LPYLTNDFLQLYAEEIAGGLLFAFLKAHGKLRPLVCGLALHSLFEIFDTEEGKEVIQIEGIKCVGVPI
jgi:hypothetical protein